MTRIVNTLRRALLLLALLQAVAAPLSEAARVDSVRSSLEFRPGDVPLLRLRFDTVAGVRYRLRASDGLATWSDSGQSVVGDGAPQEFAIELAGVARFFEVVAGLGDTFVSQITGIEYPYRVYIPEGYDDEANSDRLYPIIYATDGQWYAEGFSQAIRMKGKEAILVAIEQGPNDRRAVDYTLPGARAYFTFLTTELLPAVESVYRVDSTRRGLSGASYGGLFVGMAMLLDDAQAPLFRNFLSYDGSFWRDPELVAAVESQRAAKGRTLNATLFISSVENYFAGNRDPVEKFQERLRAVGYSGLTIISRRFNTTHGGVGQPSFEAALDLLY